MVNFLRNIFSSGPRMSATEQLIEQLDRSYAEREAAIAQLVASDDPKLPDVLLAALSNASPSIRQGAATALGRIREPRAVRELLRLVPRSKGSIEVYSGEVVEALGLIGDPTAVEPLARLMDETLPSALALTLPQALARLGDRRSLDWLLNRLTSDTLVDELRLEAANCLTKILDKEDRAVVEKAIRALDAKLKDEEWRGQDTSGTRQVLEAMKGILARIAPDASGARETEESDRADPVRIEAIFRAAGDGDAASVAKLLDEGVDPNAESPMRSTETVLLRAARHGHADVVRVLLEKGAKVDAVENDEGYSSLINASERGHLEVVKLLLKRNADTGIHTKYTSQSALMSAARMGRVEVAQALLEAGANPNSIDSYQNATALVWAMWNGHRDVATLLIEKGADVNLMGAMCAAVISKDPGLVQALIDRGADVNGLGTSGWSPLMHAAAGENAEIIRLLVRHGAKVHDKDQPAWERLKADNHENHDKMMDFVTRAGAESQPTT